MSVLFQTLINTGKHYSFRKVLNASVSSCKCLIVRNRSDLTNAPKKFVTFDEVVAQRREEARRSLVVQVNSESSFNELYGYCSQYATISGIHHYKNAGGEHFMLIEFASEEHAKEILRSCSSHHKDVDVMAMQSPFLWFRTANRKHPLTVPDDKQLLIKDGTNPVSEDALLEQLMQCETISDQIQLLYEKTMLNDLGVRLRYMVARQLEMVFESLYANVAIRPFGSSVNGFGRMGCDLDLVLTNLLTPEMTDPEKRLIFQEKKCEGGLSPWQRHMELVGELVELRVPGALRVHRILNARVPIVKYNHEFVHVDCDLAYSNMSGVYMSELLWLYGTLDPRVRPLTFLVRRWASTAGLTSPHPGRWITNFPLTLMVLFFLQQRTKDGFLLPSFKYLTELAGKEDIRIAEENVNCTFIRNLNRLPTNSYGQCQSNLQTLLLQFFEFYSQFDFHERAISINEGTSIRKPNNLPLYIVNPLEQTLNVSRNVSFEECERLKMEVRNAAWLLESCNEKEKGDDWGILSLIETKTSRGLKKLLRVGNSHRLVSVKDLFEEEDSKRVDKRIDKSASAKVTGSVPEKKMKFKNSSIANEVYRIRRNKLV